MWNWFRKRSPVPGPFRGAPAHPRQKTYSAQSGYVYQYFFEGQRATSRRGESGTEFLFSIASSRKPAMEAIVFLEDSLVPGLRATERYAVAKLSLLQAFDERSQPERMREEITPAREDVQRILATLDLAGS